MTREEEVARATAIGIASMNPTDAGTSQNYTPYDDNWLAASYDWNEVQQDQLSEHDSDPTTSATWDVINITTNESGDTTDGNGLTVAAGFEAYSYDSSTTQAAFDEVDNPYLDVGDADELDEAAPGYIPEPDPVEQIADALEDVRIAPETDEDEDPSEIESFPNAGKVKNHRDHHLDSLLEERDGAPFKPFRNAAEFELVKWLNDLPLSKVDSFLQLDWVGSLL